MKNQNLLAKFRERPLQHPAQVQLPDAKLTYVGSEACKACHPNESKQYETTKHSHAYDALVKYAKRPSNRQFDGECVVCHTVGFEYVGGYENAAEDAAPASTSAARTATAPAPATSPSRTTSSCWR